MLPYALILTLCTGWAGTCTTLEYGQFASLVECATQARVVVDQAEDVSQPPEYDCRSR